MQYKQYQIGFLKTSNVELFDLLKGWIGISIAFGLALSGTSVKFFESFVVALVAVGTGFLFHEMAHKVVAQHYKHFAEFRSFDQMIILAILMGFFGFVFAAPGAVMIQARYYNKKQDGLISLAGPAMNIVLAVIFLFLDLFVNSGLGQVIVSYGFMINSWLALFNMIPFWLFDGKKIFNWNKAIWGISLVVCIFFVFVLRAIL